MPDQFISCDIQDVLVGEPLPVPIFLYVNFRFMILKQSGEALDRASFERIQLTKIKNFFIAEKDHPKFVEWSKAKSDSLKSSPGLPELDAVREEGKRRLMDIFIEGHKEAVVKQSLDVSKRIVSEVMKMTYAAQSLSTLQSYSRGTLDHSINVSVLSVYLAMHMGYSHMLILQHVGAGALMHDMGKSKVTLNPDEPPETFEEKMKDHPTLGGGMILEEMNVPKEVQMIIEQHHEAFDGSGFPNRLRGPKIYDLARIVSIANTFDELVSNGQGSLVERQRHAITQLDQVLFRKFEPVKLEKALKILRLGV